MFILIFLQYITDRHKHLTFVVICVIYQKCIFTAIMLPISFFIFWDKAAALLLSNYLGTLYVLA